MFFSAVIAPSNFRECLKSRERLIVHPYQQSPKLGVLKAAVFAMTFTTLGFGFAKSISILQLTSEKHALNLNVHIFVSKIAYCYVQE